MDDTTDETIRVPSCWKAPNGDRVTVTGVGTGPATVYFEVDSWGPVVLSLPTSGFLLHMNLDQDETDEEPEFRTSAPKGTPWAQGTETIHMKEESPFYYADAGPMLAGDFVQVTTGSLEDGTLFVTQCRIIGFSTTPIPDTILAVSQLIVQDTQQTHKPFRVAPVRAQFIGR